MTDLPNVGTLPRSFRFPSGESLRGGCEKPEMHMQGRAKVVDPEK